MTAKIILIGPPGSGKSSVGRQLHKITGLDFVDTDSLIEEREGSSISDIFLEQGEPYFRKIEEEIVGQTLDSSKGIVSLGGGSILSGAIQDKLAGVKNSVIYLEVSISNAAPRVGFNKERPLLVGNPRAKWQSLMEARRPIYEALSGHKISTDNKKPNQVAEEIKKAVGL